MALNRYNITDAIQGKSHNECNGQTNPSNRQTMQKKLQENILISDSNMNVPCSWYCVKHWCCLVFCRHIVGLMTLALDSMIEPSQSHAYPEASTILRSIVYLKLQPPRLDDRIRFAGTYYLFLWYGLCRCGGLNIFDSTLREYESMWKSSKYFVRSSQQSCLGGAVTSPAIWVFVYFCIFL